MKAISLNQAFTEFYKILEQLQYSPEGPDQFLLIGNHQAILDSRSLFCLLGKCQDQEITAFLKQSKPGVVGRFKDKYQDVLKMIGWGVQNRLIVADYPEVLPGQAKNKLLMEEITALVGKRNVKKITNELGYLYILEDDKTNEFYVKYLSEKDKALQAFNQKLNSSGVLMEVVVDEKSNLEQKIIASKESTAEKALLALSTWLVDVKGAQSGVVFEGPDGGFVMKDGDGNRKPQH